MTDTIILLIKMLFMLLPFLLFTWLNGKANLKKEERSRQLLMPVVALIFGIIALLLLSKINGWVVSLLHAIPAWLDSIGEWIGSLLGGVLGSAEQIFNILAELLRNVIARLNLTYWLCFLSNGAIMLGFITVKKILLVFFKRIFKPGNSMYEWAASLFYSHDEEAKAWYVSPHFGQGRTLIGAFYYGSVALSVIAMIASWFLFRNELLAVPFYPVFGILVLGETYFFLDGLTRQEMMEESTEAEDEESKTITNYALLRKALRKLMGDKLSAEGTQGTRDVEDAPGINQLLQSMEESINPQVEAYGRYMRTRVDAGFTMDPNYLSSGLDLMQGKSILFNNPFYYDLIPYAFYSMNRTLLRHKKVLIVLGRHGIEGDISTWCNEGLKAITNVPDLWNIGVLSQDAGDLDVGIITRSSVHDLPLHETKREFFAQVEFVVLIEPSLLITTAQIGLNSIVRYCQQNEKPVTFCSTDKNCDGLVDALSHILMTSISEVSATSRHQGACSYMCWETDQEHLQHRMLPNLSRYLGVGTELSLAALKNQISSTSWYGGEVFPVVDMHWIAKQYYYDLMHYAQLPQTQQTMDERFHVSHNLWDARQKEHQYLTVEDECCNMFEIKRIFSTRATNQSFINVILQEYLLKDYMAENESIFNADPKAIPYIVADYARTVRNVVLRLCLRMSAGQVAEDELRQELMLIGVETDNLAESFWHQICAITQPIGAIQRDTNGEEVLSRIIHGKTYTFGPDTICQKRKFSMKLGKMQTLFFIADVHFQQALLGDLQNAGYIAEEESGEQRYIGNELRGQIFQKFLPGQFFTFNGKYYEMLNLAADGRILVRRAADHINGRYSYRQERRYTISNAVDAEGMGDRRDVSGLRITRQFADFCVETSAYWQMSRYNDFASAKKTVISGIPKRTYYNKQILRIDLPESASLEVRHTMTLLFNEVFRTLFADNQAYITAVMAGEMKEPITYHLAGDNGFEPNPTSIYILEDSQLDLGLLIAVERNLWRIFSIICDYLDWHETFLEASLNPPPEPAVPDYTLPEDPNAEPEPTTKMGRLRAKIGKIFAKPRSFFKKIKQAISNFFGKIFKRKKKADAEDEPAAPEAEPIVQAPPESIDRVQNAEQPAVPDDVTEQGSPENLDAERPEEMAESATAEPDDGFVNDEESDSENEAPVEETVDSEEAETEPVVQETVDDENETGTEDDGALCLFSMSSLHTQCYADADPAKAEEDDASAEEEAEGSSFEPEHVLNPMKTMVRRPYHERHYLLFGGTEVPEQLDLAGTLALLREMGCGDGALKQARDSRNIAEQIEKNFVPNRPGSRYCDFCGVELIGTEYELLSDGRERCVNCSRTAVKTAAEFEAIYHTVKRNMEAFFGAKITVPVRVQMVNAKKLHKKLGKSFVPTGKFDGRVLGVAIKERNKYSILVENGSPRLASTMTIAHELTHIWQYQNWDAKGIVKKYGADQRLEIYEGMAKWAEIQYTYLIGETAEAKREEICARIREDEYGRGFRKYVTKYPLSLGTHLESGTPFDVKDSPL